MSIVSFLISEELITLYLPKVVKFLTSATVAPVLKKPSKGVPDMSRCIQHSEENMASTFCSLFEVSRSH